MCLRGRDVSAQPEIVSDPDEVERLLRIMTRENPMVNRFVGIPRDADGRLQRAALTTAIQHGFRIIRWHLEDSQRADRQAA